MYSAIDTVNGNEVVIKICSDAETNRKEHQVLFLLNSEKKQSSFPKLLGGGAFNLDNNTALNYVVVQKLGLDLKHYLFKQKRTFSLQTVC